MLHLHGKPVSPDLIERYSPTNPKGLSLSEIRDALSTHGLDTEVLRCTTDDFPELDTPFLAIATSPNGDQNHYFVIVHADETVLLAMDATTGLCYRSTN